jgi:hypothetical protein
MGNEAPLFDAARDVAIDPRDAVRVVDDFLTRCAAWAEERELPARLTAMSADPTPEHAAKLHAWASWLAFVRHAQREVRDGTLDHWFRG